MDTKALVVHGHFYQPARGNPLSREPLREPDAAPYENWNARITDECYEPNARLGNIKHISFNLGETLARWMAENTPEVYAMYVAADRYNVQTYGVGNAIAQTMHHTILPLERHADKVTQVAWGRSVFSHRFGRLPDGMWLPEMAVDLETLEVLKDHGITWTILTDSQIIDKPVGCGPFWVELPSGRRMTIFVRDEGIANDIAFNLGHFGGAGRWAKEKLAPHREEAGPLTLIATDGETFGHHWPGEEHFLHWLLREEAKSAGYEVTTLARIATEVEPYAPVRIKELTAWSSMFGVGRWVTGSPDTPGNSFWKGALRRAMDNLRWQADSIYHEVARAAGVPDPIALRDAYIRVMLGHTPEPHFLREQELSLTTEQEQRLRLLLRAQVYRQRMYTSCAYFFADLDDLSTRYGIASAAQVVMLTRQATGIDLEADLRADLRVANDIDREGRYLTGADIYDDLLADLDRQRVARLTAV